MAEYRTPPKNKKSLSERLKGHFSQDAPDREEKEKIKALAEEIGQRQFSTIARVMSEGRGPSSGVQSRGTTAVYRILEEVEDHPGYDIHELARSLGEKSIFVLSHVDELVREGLLVRLQDGKLYRSRDVYQAELTLVESDEDHRISKDRGQRAIEQGQHARILLQVYRYLTSEMNVEPECKDKLIVRMGKGKFFEMKVIRGLGNISFFGVHPGDLLDRFKQNVKIDRSRINYSRMTGILDIRGCNIREIESVLPWVKKFYRFVKSQSIS